MALVTIKLFGMLGAMAGTRDLQLELAEPAHLRDALDALEARFGPDFRRRIMRTPRALQTYVRVFVNETEVTDLDTVLQINGSPTEVSLMLLPAAEGG